MRLAIQRSLKRELAPFYPAAMLADKQELVYQHIYDTYPDADPTIFAETSETYQF